MTTPLLQAVSDNDIYSAAHLLFNDSDPNQVDPDFYCGISPLALAVKRGNAVMVELLLLLKAEKNVLSEHGHPLIFASLFLPKEDVARVLLKHGAFKVEDLSYKTTECDIRDIYKRISGSLYSTLCKMDARKLPSKLHNEKIRQSIFP